MSDSSRVSSAHSLRSHGPIVNPLHLEDSHHSKARKKAVHWNKEETTALLKFLITELPKSGNENFKKVTWMAASSLMATRFTVKKGGSNLSAKPFKTKGFVHYHLIEALMPDKSWGQHTLCPPTNRQPLPESANGAGAHGSVHPPATTGGPLNLQQLFSATDEIGNDTSANQPRNQASAPSSTNPNTLPPSIPFSFIGQPIGTTPAPSALTSVSHTKRKSPASESSANGSRKRSRPASVTAMAQQAGGVAMWEITAAVKDFTCTMAPPPPPIDDLSAAIDILNQHVELTPMQRLDVSDFLMLDKNKNHAIIFRKLDEESREAWLNCRLSEIEIAHQAQGFDIMTIND
ncbi:hypothetical protein HD554DRAFT_2169763 [Boletus coccyginus]|nr:hypothetical protein HD554DRAFT_2169763 [Boletus coccyginus]